MGKFRKGKRCNREKQRSLTVNLCHNSATIKIVVLTALRYLKDLQKVVVELKGWGGAEKAKDVIEKSREA